MLKNYVIENFKSFKYETKVELDKTNYQMLTKSNVYGDITKGLMFVGANASGKSNSILAIKFLLECLFGKNEISFASYCCCFSENPLMRLSYSFNVDGHDLCYIITYQKIDEFITEHLTIDNNEVFERNGSTASTAITEQRFYTDVPQSTLFLRDIYFNTKFRGNETLQKWFAFLSNSVCVDLYKEKITVYRDIDLSLKDYLDDNGTAHINDFFEEFGFCQRIEYDTCSKGKKLFLESLEKNIFFKRKGIEEPISFEFESLGNRNLLKLLPAFFHCIDNSSMLILDEFSSGFHNELEELLVKYFMVKAKDSQLIFVSHSTNLLTNRLLRPDQIYSVDFSENGTVLKRFSSEKPREAQNLEKMYLGGVFNGVPKYENHFE